MSRVTAPASKLARSLNTASVGSHSHATLHTSHGSVLMPKYAELLKKANPEADSHARGITTTHRPIPQPKPSASHARPLMQTFSTSAPAPSSTIAALPSLQEAPSSEFSAMRMPLLPDSFLRHAVPETEDAPLAAPTISVVAANPGDVLPASALTEVEGMGVDGVELRFAHDAEPEAQEPGMLRDLWRGLVEDVTGGSQPKTA